jgi:hypothetical protein
VAGNDLVITITARDQATQVLQNVRQEMRLFGPSGETLVDFSKRTEDVNKNLLNLEAGAGRSARSVRALVAPLASELSPALSQTSAQIVNVVQSASLLGSRMGALTLGAAGLAAIMGGRLLEAWQANKDAMREFDRAMSSADFGRITGQVQGLRMELEKLDQREKELRAARGGLGPGFGPVDFLLGESVLDLRNVRSRRGQAFENLQEAARRQQLTIQGRQASDFTRAEMDVGATIEAPEASGLEIRRRIGDLQRQVVEVGILDPIERAFQSALREAQNLREQPGGGPEQAQLADAMIRRARAIRDQAVTDRRLSFQARPIEGIDDVGRFESMAPGIGVSPLVVSDVQRRLFEIEAREFEGRAAAPEPGIEDVGRFESLAPGVRDAAGESAIGAGRRAVTDADERGRLRALDLGRESLQIDQQIIELGRQRIDLTDAQRDALELSISIQREQLQLADLTIQREREQIPAVQELIDRKKELVSAQEALTRSVIEQQRFERTDAAGGIAAGVRDIENDAANAGERMHRAFVSSYHDITRSFGDIVVDGLFNQGDNAAEIGKALGKRLVAGFVDQISTQLFARAFGALGSAFGTGTAGTGARVFTAIPGVASPFALAGGEGAAVANAAGSGSPIFSSTYQPFASPGGGAAASPAGIRPSGGIPGTMPAQTGVLDAIGLGGQGALGQFTGGFFGASVSAVDLVSAYSIGGFQAVAAVQAGYVTVAGGQLVPSVSYLQAVSVGTQGFEAATATASASVQGATAASGASTAAGVGATAAAAAAGVLAAAALAYTAYNAYQTGDVVGGAVGGAVSGAALGTVIYPGVGTVVGLVVGAAIGGVSGQLGKEEQEVAGDRRRNEADRQRRGAWIYQDLMNAIQTGVDQEDTAGQTVRTGHSVGGLLLGVAALNQSGFLSQAPWGWGPSENARKTLEILTTGLGYSQPILDFEWDRLNSTAELIASWHNPRGITEGDIEIARNAEALMAAFANKQGQTILIGYDEQLSTGLRGSAGGVTRTTLLRSDRSREAAGQDIFIVGNTTDGLDDNQLVRLMNRMVKLDRDGDLKILRIESDDGATVTTGNWSV